MIGERVVTTKEYYAMCEACGDTIDNFYDKNALCEHITNLGWDTFQDEGLCEDCYAIAVDEWKAERGMA